MSGPPSGLQAERTVLAWDRTALGFAATGALLLRDVATVPRLLVPAGVALLLALLCALIGRRRTQRVHGPGVGDPPGREVTLIGAGVIVLGMLVAITTAL